MNLSTILSGVEWFLTRRPAKCSEGKATAYIGFDPCGQPACEAAAPIMGLAPLGAGHTNRDRGGGTGLIGDERQNQEERQLLTRTSQKTWVGIKEQLSRFLDFDARKKSGADREQTQLAARLP
jgi:tyrosyl-tRNA synthetase